MLNGQSKMVSNEVNHQNATSLAKSSVTNSSNTTEQQDSSTTQNSNRTQDDAMVSYVFQRQNDGDYQPYHKSSRWFGAEDGNLIDVNFVISQLIEYF